MSLLTSLLAPGNGISQAHDFDVFGPVYSNTGWPGSGVAINQSAYYNGHRVSSGAQNDEMVFAPRLFVGGTWALTAMHTMFTNRGIYTFAYSTDASTWTDFATVDGYAAADTPGGRTEVTGITMPSGALYIRVKMATKNASASAYVGTLSGFSMARTGAA